MLSIIVKIIKQVTSSWSIFIKPELQFNFFTTIYVNVLDSQTSEVTATLGTLNTKVLKLYMGNIFFKSVHRLLR